MGLLACSFFSAEGLKAGQSFQIPQAPGFSTKRAVCSKGIPQSQLSLLGAVHALGTRQAENLSGSDS